jgi:hypothetical protein
VAKGGSLRGRMISPVEGLEPRLEGPMDAALFYSSQFRRAIPQALSAL